MTSSDRVSARASGAMREIAPQIAPHSDETVPPTAATTQSDELTAAQAVLATVRARESNARSALAAAAALVKHASDSLAVEHARLSDHASAVERAVLAKQTPPSATPSMVDAIASALATAQAQRDNASTAAKRASEAAAVAEAKVVKARDTVTLREMSAVLQSAREQLAEFGRTLTSGKHNLDGFAIERVHPRAGWRDEVKGAVHPSNGGACLVTFKIELEPNSGVPYLRPEYEIASEEAKAEAMLIRSVELDTFGTSGAKARLAEWRALRAKEKAEREAMRAGIPPQPSAAQAQLQAPVSVPATTREAPAGSALARLRAQRAAVQQGGAS